MGGHSHAPADLTLRKGITIHCTEGWVGPSAGLDGCRQEKICCFPIGVWIPNRPARSGSLFQSWCDCRSNETRSEVSGM